MQTRPFVTLNFAELQTRLLEMGGLVEAAISTSLSGIDAGRVTPSEEIWSPLRKRINELNIEIDEIAVRLTAPSISR